MTKILIQSVALNTMSYDLLVVYIVDAVLFRELD